MTDSLSIRETEGEHSALLRTIEGEVIPRLILAHRAVVDGNRCDDLSSPLRPGSSEIFELADSSCAAMPPRRLLIYGVFKPSG